MLTSQRRPVRARITSSFSSSMLRGMWMSLTVHPTVVETVHQKTHKREPHGAVKVRESPSPKGSPGQHEFHDIIYPIFVQSEPRKCPWTLMHWSEHHLLIKMVLYDQKSQRSRTLKLDLFTNMNKKSSNSIFCKIFKQPDEDHMMYRTAAK